MFVATQSRPIQTTVTVDGSTYSTTTTYDSAGRIGTVTYPSAFGLTYTYNTIGYLTQIKDTASNLAYWTANAYDAESHLTQATFGNNIVANKVYSPDTGRIATIQAGTGNTVQNLSFTFNTLGNLTQRVDAVTQTTDDMSYDGLNRLTQAVTSNPSLPLNVTKTVTYNAIGNIITKSDVGNYTYDPARVHAVAGIAPGATGTVTASYAYDANGNMLTGRGRTVTWTSFDMVDAITQGTNAVAFTYDSEHARLKQVSSDGSTKYYLNDPTSGAMAEKIVGASLSVTWNDYVMLGGEMVALKVSGATTQTRYFHKDHLGSIVALTDETGAVVERSSFDAWGQRRTPMGEDDPLYPGQSITSQITRGFTGHEQLDSVGLVHMNGRIYEPVIGKMMSPDPTVPNPMDGQAYNRYAYVANNPLSLTDPSGFAPDGPNDRIAGGKMREQSKRATERQDRPAHHSIHQNSFAGLTNGDLNRLFPVGDVGGGINPQANQIAEIGQSDLLTQGGGWPAYFDHVVDLWGWTYIEGPSMVLRAPFAHVGTLMGYAEEACGVCFDPGAMMATMAPGGPPGMLAGAIEIGGAWAWRGIGWSARLLGGVRPTGQFYSVGFEMRLSPSSYPGVSRGTHFQEANDALLQAMEADAAFAQDMQSLGVNLQRTPTGLAPRTSPSGWSWHHAEDPGAMQLVPRSQHEPGSIFQDALHPNGQGGYSIWGR